MSKELTEQWQNGNIQETYYYVKCPWSEGEVDIRYVHNGVDDWKEIVEPVPSYHDLCELKQELEICKDDKADLYAKLCNALMQLKEANEIIANFRTYDFTRDDEIAEEYQVKYGIAGEKIYTNKKPSKEFERWRKKITKSFEKKLKGGV